MSKPSISCRRHLFGATGELLRRSPEALEIIRGSGTRGGLRRLHWHDLRHEYASRLVERGVPLAQVRDLLGHASITTTERYDNQTLAALQAAVGRLEAGKTFEPQPDPEHTCAPNRSIDSPRRCKVSSFYQDRAGDPSHGASKAGPSTTDDLLKEEQLTEWYRYGDSNPGSVAENHVS